MPIVNFTMKALDALKPPLTQASVEYWDSSTPGFGLRISKQGRKVWIVRFKIRNTREIDRVTLSSYEATSLADARIAAREYLDAASRGINLRQQRQLQSEAEYKKQIEEERRLKEQKTFGWVANQYIEIHAKRNKRSWEEDQRILNREILNFWDHPKQGWKDRPIKEITKFDVLDLLEKTLERTQQKNEKGIGGKGVHANRVFSLVRKIFNFALELEREWIDRNPCEKLRRPLKNEESRDHVLSFDGIRSIWTALEDEIIRDKRTTHTSAIFRLMLITAQRGGEVRTMAWDEVDLEHGVWNLPKTKTKNKHSHSVPLSTHAIAILNELASARNTSCSAWVFPNPKDKSKPMSSFQKAIQRVREKTSVPYVSHDLRRTSASLMAAIGIPPHLIKKILNHSERQDITHIYNRYAYDNEKRDALQKWGDYLMNIMNKPEEISIIPMPISSKQTANALERLA